MTQVWFLTEGNYWAVHKFISALSGQIYSHNRSASVGEHLQYNVRPVNLWNVSVYDHEVKRLLHNLGPYFGLHSKTRRHVFTYARLLAKLLGVKRVPDAIPTPYSIPRQYVNILVLGKTLDVVDKGHEYI